jgi:hypothetical protein
MEHMTTMPAFSSGAAKAHAESPRYPKGFFRNDCRLCRGKKMKTFLDFGMHPHSDGFIPAEKAAEPEPFFPLAAQLCLDCGQVQINFVVDPDYLYGDDYVYNPNITKTFNKHFMEMAKEIVEEYQIPQGGLAVDIGSNVGLLLSGFKEQGLKIQGVDPTPNMTAIAIQNGIDTLTEYFSSNAAKQIVAEKGKASVITGTNVIAHIDDMDDMMAGIDILMEEKGIFVIEAPYLADLIEKFEYDTIYHQHLSYFSIAPLSRFFKRFSMEIIDVKQVGSHGGSVRIFVARAGARPVQPMVQKLIDAELASGLHTWDRMEKFAEDVQKQRSALIELLVTLKSKGSTIVAVGAPAKGSTLLNFCGINGSIVDFATERNMLKVGRFTPGSRLPIKTDEALLEAQPDYALILSWNFAPEIMKNLHIYSERGGRFIIPVPTPQIV